jgi:hypothetical protein
MTPVTLGRDGEQASRSQLGDCPYERNQQRTEPETGCCPAPPAVMPAGSKPKRTGYQYLFGPILVGAIR